MATHKAATKQAGQARNRRAVRAGRELAEILTDGVAYQTGYAVESWRTQALTAAGGDDPAPPVQPNGLLNPRRWETTLSETFDYITRFTVDELETDFGIRVTQDQPFVTRIAERLVASIDGWMDDFKARVGRVISDGHATQASVNQVADTLEERGLAFGRRATTIARTEMVAASNQASLHGALAFAQPGDTKVWMATSDSRTRDDHRDADGQEVPVEEPFVVGGERGDVPGDTSFSPEQRANCRCTWVWRPADR